MLLKKYVYFKRISQILNKKGQSLVEYLLLMLVISTLSMIFLSTMNDRIAKVWVGMISIVAEQDISTDDLR